MIAAPNAMTPTTIKTICPLSTIVHILLFLLKLSAS